MAATTRSRDMAHAHCQFLPLKWPIHIAFVHYSATDQDRTCTKFGILHTGHKLDDPTCDPPQQANSLCHVQGQPTAAVALLYMAL